jgi:hypothetical protein
MSGSMHLSITGATYHRGQAPLIGFREWVVIIYGSDDITEIEGNSR